MALISTFAWLHQPRNRNMHRFPSLAWWSAVLAAAVLLLAPAPRAAADVIYAIDGAGGGTSALYIGSSTANGGALTQVAPVTIGGSPVALTSIAFNPATGVLYGAASSTGELVTINTANANATIVGSYNLPSGGTVTSIAFSPDGSTLYGYVKQITGQGQNTEGLYTLGTTGGSTLVGYPGAGAKFTTSGDGMALNSAGTLYLAGKGASGTLYTLSTSNGAPTAGKTLSGAPYSGGQIKALGFDSSGTMYGINLQNTGSFPAEYVTIDPNTGIVTDQGAMPDGMIGLAFQPTSVPEPGSLALVACAAVTGWLVHARTRRRQTVPGGRMSIA
jgi:DNA-binding beta-propeller fold protein YncE